MQSKRIICCWAMGLTQHRNAVGTIQEIINFLLLGGNIGRQGAGPCPVRGHSNVQGDRTMGIWERMNDRFLDKLGAEFDFLPPRKNGADTVEAIKRMHDGPIRVFIGMGGNFLSATPDTEFTAKALQRCRLTAHVSIKLNRSHLITGEIGLILPCLGRTEIDRQATGEQFVTVEDSMGIINPSRGLLQPACEHLRSEAAIVAGLARATLGNRSRVDWDGLIADYGRIRDHIDHVIPGFERFNERVARDIFYLPNAVRDERKFNTDIGKAKFTVHPIPRNELPPGRFIMMTIRSHDQFNTHLYGLDDRYRGVFNGRRVVFMNPEGRGRSRAETSGNRRPDKSLCGRGAIRSPISGGPLQHSAWLRGYLFPRGKRPDLDKQRGGTIKHTRKQVRYHLGCPIKEQFRVRITPQGAAISSSPT
jgi:molybdopterin-dependent oxidoreductase alpha subunit